MNHIKASVFGLTLFTSAVASAAAFVDGEQYEQLPISIETSDPSRVEVVEVFSYACIHCSNFEPVLATWRGRFDDRIAFRRVPAVFSPQWRVLAQAYYTAEALKVIDQVHQPLFDGIHKDQVNLADPARLAELFERVAGVSPADFKSAFDSMTVRVRVQQADAYTRIARADGTPVIDGVPTLIVNGKYKVTGQLAGSNTAMLEVVDHLVDLEAATRTAAKSAAIPGS
jgi:thiol:disulfide interchange protein DsbA